VYLVADESVDRQIVDRLRQDGHQIMYVAEEQPGITDDIILGQANRQEAPLLTADKGFGELVFRQRRVTNGVVLIRLAGLSSTGKAEVVASAISNHASELLQAFTVITPHVVRIRRPVP
jgi:predicted nuclease of predicted toxin-antitoxin system